MQNIYTILENEIRSYRSDKVSLSDGVSFSQYKLVKRISLYENQIYPKGKVDSQKDYKYWYDIISPRVNDEIKNIDFDRNNILIYSEAFRDRVPVYIANLSLQGYLTKTGQGEELNDAVEEFSAWGNCVWKKVKDGYERVDLKNFYVLNQTAKTLEDSTVVERHEMTQSDLRKKSNVWKNIDFVIKDCKNREFTVTGEATPNSTTNPYYEVYERNGEIAESVLFAAQGKHGGSDDKFVLSKIIVCGLSTSLKDEAKYILYANEISEMPYREAHRGRYKGKWFREGLYEVLFDCQTRANQLGNQIAKGLEWASKIIFRSSDDMFIQNVLTDMRNGDIIRSRDIAQVETRMQSLDQLIADWNRNLQVADRLANSYEIVRGETLPSNTPFKLGSLMDMNANKLFDFLREKLALGFECLINDWILPMLLKDLKTQTVIDLTNSDASLKEYYEMLVNGWYIKNLPTLPPHSSEIAKTIKDKKMEEVMANKKAAVQIEEGFWDNFKPRAKVVITGENVKKAAKLETLQNFIQLESDPVRRSYLIDLALAETNIDVSDLPRSTPEQLLGQNQEVNNQENMNKAAMTVPQNK